MSELEKILEKINEQFKDIFERIEGINGSLKQARSGLIGQIKTECLKTEVKE